LCLTCYWLKLGIDATDREKHKKEDSALLLTLLALAATVIVAFVAWRILG
jgi:hypothetical protein